MNVQKIAASVALVILTAAVAAAIDGRVLVGAHAVRIAQLEKTMEAWVIESNARQTQQATTNDALADILDRLTQPTPTTTPNRGE